MFPNELYNVIAELKKITSINDKLSILLKYYNDNELQKFFVYSLNKQKYGIKKIPENIIIQEKTSTVDDFNNGLKLLDDLSSRKITGNKAINAVIEYLEGNDYFIYQLFTKMLTKFPDCGVSQLLCNRIWNNMFIQDIKLCKAQPYSEKNISEIHYPAISQRKCDGARCLAFCENKNVTLYTSNGKKYYNLLDLCNEIANINIDNFILDGELLVIENNKVFSRKEGNGILNKSIHNTITPEEANKVHFIVWDIISKLDYDNGKGTRKYCDSMQLLKKNINSNHISIVESKIVNNKEEALTHFREMLNRGEEGTILKNIDMLWEGKRSKNCVKFKIVIENTLKIVDFIEGNGKYAYNLGALICESSDGLVKVKIGSGLTDDMRISIWKKMNKYKGKMIEVLSNGIIQAEDGTYSLFLPRFLELRTDKNEADSYEMIKALSDGSSMLKGM